MLLPKATSKLFALSDQYDFYRCGKCGSTDIRWHAFDLNAPNWPSDITGYVMPDAPKIERDDFGPITTRTVRCR